MRKYITFYQRLERSILSGKKNVTIRDEFDSHYSVGQVLDACTHEDNRKMCRLEILSIEPVKFDELNRAHAKAENLPFVFVLKWIIRKIYPSEQNLFFIRFRILSEG